MTLISRVVFENFRNFQGLDLETNQGFVVLAGKNGAGKTNFLEGVYFGATLKRFSESDFGQLFRDGDDYLRVRLQLGGSEAGRQEVFAQRQETGYKYKFTKDGKAVKRSEYAGDVPAVSFLPQDLGLLTRSPGNRRRYLDESLSLVSPQYRRALSQYQKALRHRNELLGQIREGSAPADQLGVWDEQLAEHGSLIIGLREEFLGFVNGQILGTLGSISPEVKQCSLDYVASGEGIREKFLQQLSGIREQEIARASTQLGPHRDDFTAAVGGKKAAGRQSRGQMRAITLALKVLETEYVREKIGKAPILLLDDVFSEFDHEHQQRLLQFLRSFEQVFFTTAHLEEVTPSMPKGSQVFKIENGQIK